MEPGVQAVIEAETVNCLECAVKLRGISTETGLVRVQRADAGSGREVLAV